MIIESKQTNTPPMVEMETVDCPLCGSGHYARILESEDLLHALPGRFDVQKCEKCGMVFTNPRPAPESMSYYYPSSYEPHVASSYSHMSSPKDGRRELSGNLLSQKLYSIYSNFDRGHNYVPLDNRLIPLEGKKGSILDVGAGSGGFLNLLRSQGWSVSGIEASENAIQVAKTAFGIETVYHNFKEANFSPSSFDAITMWWTLEHLHSPKEVLRACHWLLKPDGVLVGGVPNFASFESKIFGRFYFGLDLPRHLLHFTPSTLKAILEKNGFHIQKIVFDINGMGIRESVRNYLKARNVNRRITDSRLIIAASYLVSIVFAKLRRSGLMVFIASKK